MVQHQRLHVSRDALFLPFFPLGCSMCAIRVVYGPFVESLLRGRRSRYSLHVCADKVGLLIRTGLAR